MNSRCADDSKRIAILAGTMGVELERKNQEVKDLKLLTFNKRKYFQVSSSDISAQDVVLL